MRAFGHGQLRSGQRQVGVRLLEPCLELGRVDEGEQVATLDPVTYGHRDAVDDSGDPRADLDLGADHRTDHPGGRDLALERLSTDPGGLDGRLCRGGAVAQPEVATHEHGHRTERRQAYRVTLLSTRHDSTLGPPGRAGRW